MTTGLRIKRAAPFALALGIWFLPVPAGLTAPAWHLFAVFAAAIASSVTIDIASQSDGWKKMSKTGSAVSAARRSVLRRHGNARRPGCQGNRRRPSQASSRSEPSPIRPMMMIAA